jgi:hypothetical protein
LAEQVEPPGLRLTPLLVFDDQVTQTQEWRIVSDSVLNPFLAELRRTD